MHQQKYKIERISHWDRIAKERTHNIFNSSYHHRLVEVYRNLIPPGSKILEIGCGNGDLLASLSSSRGVGLDFSSRHIQLAKSKYPQLLFLGVDVQDISSILNVEPFDFIIMSDLINDLWDIQETLLNITPYCNQRTRIILNFYSRLWQPILTSAQRLKLANPTLQQNWITREDLTNLLHLAGIEVIKKWVEVLLPLPIPIFTSIFNRILVKIWPFTLLALSNFMVARPMHVPDERKYTVSVIVPARNEAGNIENILKSIPDMGAGTEIVFVEGNSTDNTYQIIDELLPKFPQRKTSLYIQEGKGKGDAVRKGFSKASGDILMVLDADLTVPPTDLPRFYDALTSNKGEFINGVRLVYPMENEAMRFINILGNKFFSFAFSYLLSQPIKDTLCGTKALFKCDYELIAANRSYFGNFDPFGDYDLLFGAARLNLKIIDMPIRYGERTYGSTNIQRWRHGWLLLKMVVYAAKRIKFV